MLAQRQDDFELGFDEGRRLSLDDAVALASAPLD